MTERDCTRRGVLIGGAALAATAAAMRTGRAASPGLRAVVRLDGRDYVFDAADAEDLGDFVSPAGFRQACLRVRRPDLPLTVLFRPDRDGARLEAVFELGRLWDGAPAHLGPYRADILADGRTVAAVDVPRHLWFARWRWQSAPRPVRAEVGDLIARALLPPYARAVAGFQPPPEPAAKRYGTMELAGVMARMGTTGERADIGLVTEHQARFLCTGAPDALATARAQAEAAGTLPWHIRDERTDAPVDLDVHAKMSWYGNARAASPHVAIPASDISIDSAHQPALAYLPYILTGDPYHLEDIQFAANFNRGVLPPSYRLSIPQTRSFAWSLRTLAQAARVTPPDAPRWLLPAAYFAKDLARTRAWFETTYVRSTDPLHTIFRVTSNVAAAREEGPRAPAGTWTAPWQDDFLVAVLGWVVRMGFPEWRPAFDWKLGSTLARTSGRSGWVRAHAAPYRLILKHGKTGPTAASWAEAWDLTRARAQWTPGDDDTIGAGDLAYYAYARGALVLAVHLGVREAAAPLAWITQQLQARRAKVAYKWLLA